VGNRLVPKDVKLGHGQVHLTIKDIPAGERPRERLGQLGPAALSLAELIAILVGSGSQGVTAVELGQRLLSYGATRQGQAPTKTGAAQEALALRFLASATTHDLCDIPGIGEAKAAVLVAAVELGRRLASRRTERVVVTSPQDVPGLFMEEMRPLEKEEFRVLLLDTKNHVMGSELCSVGSLSSSIVHPREVFKAAVRRAAASVVLVHNHPSGDPTPSREDIDVTHRLIEAGKLIGIEVLDHIIIGDNRYVSFREQGLWP